MIRRRATAYAPATRTALAVLVGLLCSALPAAAQGPTPQPVPVAAPSDLPFLRVDAGFHTQVINRFAQDRDGHLIVTASDDKTLRVWNAATGAALATLRVPISEGHEGALYAVAISPDGKTLLAGGYTGVTWDGGFAVYMFDLETQQLWGQVSRLPGPIDHLAYSPDGGSFAVAMGGTAGIWLIDANTGARIAADDDFRARATWVDFDAHGRMVATGFDGDVRLYDARGRRLARTTPVAGGHPYAVAFSPDGGTVAVGYADQPRVALLSAQTLSPQAMLAVPGEAGRGGLGAVAWARDGSLLAAGSLRGRDGSTVLRHWPAGGAGPAVDRPGLRDTVSQVAAANDGDVLLAGADPALLRLDRAGRTVFRDQGLGLDFRDMAGRRFKASADGLSVEMQTKSMQTPWLVNMAERTVTAAGPARALTPVPAPVAGPAASVADWHNAPRPRIGGQPVRLEPEELSRAYAVAPKRGFVVLGTDYELRVFRPDARMVDAVPLPAPAWAVAVSGDGRTVIAAVGDGTLRWFGLDDSGHLQPRIAMFLAADGQRWLAWTAEGQFDHSDRGGETLAGLQLNRSRAQAPEWFSFAQMYRLFYAPDTVAARLRGQVASAPAPGVDDLRHMLASVSPPGIDVSALCWAGARGEDCHPVAPSSTVRGVRYGAGDGMEFALPADARAVTVLYHLNGSAPESSAVDLFVNGRNAGRATAASSRSRPGEMRQTAQVEVGLNRIQLRAYDRDGLTYAQTRLIGVRRAVPAPDSATAAAPKHKLFILAVGIDHYPSTINSLNYAVADARAVANTIRAHAPSDYAATELTELYDQAASASSVLGAIGAIAAKASSDDTVLIYLSGHGATVGKTYYFITQNVASIESIPTAAISESALVQALAAIQARNGMMFLDTCHAGAFSLDSASQIAHETGRYVLAASASLEEALDSYDNRNGVFATAVLRGLAGGAVSGKRTTVNNFELGLFVTPLVHALATERHHNQSARFKITADDAQPFPIVDVAPTGPAPP